MEAARAEKLTGVRREICQEFFGAGFAQVEKFAELLSAEGDLRGLIGPRELERLWERHLVNSAAIVPFLPVNSWGGGNVSTNTPVAGVKEDTGVDSVPNEKKVRVADIGSGAGFPGIVAAIMRPDIRFFLIETMTKRCDWLELVVDELSLKNVTVLNCRAEEVLDLTLDEKFAVVTARAVAALDKLGRLCSPLIEKDGRLLALKGQRAAQEVADAQKGLRKVKLELVSIHEVPSALEPESTMVVELRRR